MINPGFCTRKQMLIPFTSLLLISLKGRETSKRTTPIYHGRCSAWYSIGTFLRGLRKQIFETFHIVGEFERSLRVELSGTY